MQVEIVQFPRTPIAALPYRGPADGENDAARTFVAWRIQNHLAPDKHRTYGIHYDFTDPHLNGEFPWFFHYVNVGPNVQTHEMITDVYLPLR